MCVLIHALLEHRIKIWENPKTCIRIHRMRMHILIIAYFLMFKFYSLVPFVIGDTWKNNECFVVHGMEYGFGAHDYSISGVFEVEPRTCPGFNYRCSISLGYTDMSALEFREFIESIASEYHGDTYHLIYKNCNNFTDDISHRLNCKRIPGWVNRLAKLGKQWQKT